MPVIYTEDKVAKAVGDHALGEMGVQTGGVANSIGYSNYQARQQRAAAAPVSAGSSGASGGSGGYQPFWFTEVLEDLIPLWLARLLGVAGAIALVRYLVVEGVIPPLTRGAGVNGSAVLGMAVATGIGYALGANALRILVRLLDLGLKLLLVLIVFAVVAGGLWLVARTFLASG